MPKWEYIKRRIHWESPERSVCVNWITDSQKRIFISAIEDDWTIQEACAAAWFSRQTYQNRYRTDEEFRAEVDFARTKLIRDAKTKVHKWVDNDETWEFSLKVLKARCPEEWNTQRTQNTHEVVAEVEHKSVDEMLVEYYNEE